MPKSDKPLYSYFLGIDVGKQGGISLITDRREVMEYHAFPSSYMDAVSLLKHIVTSYGKHNNLHAVIEKVWAFPKTNKSTAFSMGGSLASAETLLTVLGIPYELAAGATWQKEYKLPPRAAGELDNKDHKERLRQLAQKMFPKCEVWKGTKKLQLAICDSLLISEFARKQFLGAKV